jgi:hypothetical protein
MGDYQRLTERGRKYQTKELNRLRELEDFIEQGKIDFLADYKKGFNEGVTAMQVQLNMIAKELTEGNNG